MNYGSVTKSDGFLSTWQKTSLSSEILQAVWSNSLCYGLVGERAREAVLVSVPGLITNLLSC